MCDVYFECYGAALREPRCSWSDECSSAVVGVDDTFPEQRSLPSSMPFTDVGVT